MHREAFRINAVNPYALGRQARAAFDDLWTQVSSLTNVTKRSVDESMDSPDTSFEAPQAAYTTVLVLGATGRVGRILVRKLLLRGYSVKALVRKREGKSAELPSAVQIVEGDLGSMSSCQVAVKDVNKIIFCAAARTAFTADLTRVEDRGVMNLVKAYQDECQQVAARSKSKTWPQAKLDVADFSLVYHQSRWNITYVGSPDEEKQGRDRATNIAVAEINDENNLVFEGVLFQRGAFAEVGAELNPTMKLGGHRTKDSEGLIMRIKGDSHVYVVVLGTSDGQMYGSRFLSTSSYSSVRLPYSAFRPQFQGQGPIDPATITSIALRYENKKSTVPTGVSAAEVQAANDKDQKFCLEVDWIKAIPGGLEPDVIMVSCAGQPRAGVSDADLKKVIDFKRRGEENLRLSGLGYSVIRPGTLVEEPGGYKALVFDQGDRVSEGISAADVADICLRALHEPSARNKTFDVCYEYDADEAATMYELVARIPDKSNNYLKSAVASLAKNT
ncbi:MAG: hypothetical protein WDW38_005311 [Sanguina aurantia]